MDLVLAAQELVRRLRGKRSQAALSRRLGFTTNVVYSWEAGRREPTVSAFFRLARAVGFDVPRALRRFYPSPPSWLEGRRMVEREDVTEFLRSLASDLSASRLARATSVNRATVTRWLDGKTEPRLSELLRLVDVTTGRLLDFVALFADPSTLDATRAAYADLEAQRHIAFELPLSHAVLRALELRSYERLGHRPGFVARAVGISLAEERALLSALEGAQIIRKENGRYRPGRVLTVDTRTDPEKNWELKAFWAELSLARLRRKPRPPSALFSYNVFAISHEGYERLRRLQLDYYDELRRIVAESTSADCVALTNLHLLRLDEGG